MPDPTPPARPGPLALVGLGRMGRAHLRALRRPPALGVAALVEPDTERRREAAATGVPVFADVASMLGSRVAFCGAIVAAPTPLHRAVVEPLLRAGVPVLCEKPCCLDVADTLALARLAADLGVRLQVGYWRRYVPALVDLRARIRAGELGELSVVTCRQWDERPPAASFRRASGGIVVDMGVHELDQLRWLTGQEVDSVTGIASRVGTDDPHGDPPGDPHGDPESAQLLLGLSGGTVGIVSLGRRFPPGDMCDVEVIGTRGHALVRFLWPPDGEEVFDAALRAQAADFAAGASAEAATVDDAVAALRLAARGTAALGCPAP